MDILDNYIDELKSDLFLDRTNLEEKALFVPGIKAKWLSKMVIHKKELKKYEILMNDAKNKLISEYEKNSELVFSRPTIEKMISEHEIIKKIQQNIDTERLAIEFCEKAVTISSSMTYDIKNILEWYKLELT